MRNCIVAVLVVACLAAFAGAQEIELATGRRLFKPCQPPCTPEAMPYVPPSSESPTQPPQTDMFSDSFASAAQGGTSAPASYAPAMFGDLLGKFGTRFTSVNGGSTPGRHFVPILATSGGIKITDAESPRPRDRVYYNYNFFANTTVDVDPTVPPVGVHRHVIGLEKTLFGGNASIGLRLPFVSVNGYQEVTQTSFGDMSVIAKVALINDLDTGDLLSGGLVITTPTGPPYALNDFNQRGAPLVVFHPVQLQPFVGGIRSFRDQRLFLQGFTSVIVPTDSRDVTILWNDIGIGYWLVRDFTAPVIQGIVPMFEVHVNTPLNHRGAFNSPLGFPDIVNLTAGVQILLPRSVLGVAAGSPVTWPRPFSAEVVATYSLRF